MDIHELFLQELTFPLRCNRPALRFYNPFQCTNLHQQRHVSKNPSTNSKFNDSRTIFIPKISLLDWGRF